MGSGISSTCQTSKSTEVRNSLRSLRDPDTRRSGRKTTLVGNIQIRASPKTENASTNTNTRRSNRKIGIGVGPGRVGGVDSKHNNDKNNNNDNNDNSNNVEKVERINRPGGVLRSNSWVGNGIDHGSSTNDVNTVLSDSCDSGIVEANRKRSQLLSRSRRDQSNASSEIVTNINNNTRKQSNIPDHFDLAKSFDSCRSGFTLRSDSEFSTDVGLGKSMDSFTNSATSVELNILRQQNNNSSNNNSSSTYQPPPPVFDTRYNRPVSKAGSLRPNRRSAPNMLQISIDEAEEDDEVARQARPPRPKSAYVRKRRCANEDGERTSGDSVEGNDDNDKCSDDDDDDDDDDFWSAESITSDDDDFYSDILSIPDETAPGSTPRGEANVKLGPKFTKVATANTTITTTRSGTTIQNEDWWTAMTPLENDEALSGLPSARTPSTFRSWMENDGANGGGSNLGKKASERSISSVILLSPCGEPFDADAAAAVVVDNAYPLSARSPRTPTKSTTPTTPKKNNNIKDKTTGNVNKNTKNRKNNDRNIKRANKPECNNDNDITRETSNSLHKNTVPNSSLSHSKNPNKTSSIEYNEANINVDLKSDSNPNQTGDNQNTKCENNDQNNASTISTKRKFKIFKNKNQKSVNSNINDNEDEIATRSINTTNKTSAHQQQHTSKDSNDTDLVNPTQKPSSPSPSSSSSTSRPAQHVSNSTNPSECCDCFLHANTSTTSASTTTTTPATSSEPSLSQQHRPECRCQKTVAALEEHIFTLVLLLSQNAGVSLVNFQNMVMTSRPQFLQALASLSDSSTITTHTNDAKSVPALESSLAKCLYDIRESANPRTVSAFVHRHLSALKSVGPEGLSEMRRRGGEEMEKEDFGGTESGSDEDAPLPAREDDLRSSSRVITKIKEASDMTQIVNVADRMDTNKIVTGLPPASSTTSPGRGHTMINGSKDRSRTALNQRSTNDQGSIISDSQIATTLVETKNRSPSAKNRPDSGIVVSSSASYSSSSEAAREAEVDVTSQTEWIAKSLEMLQEIYTVQTQDYDSIKALVKAITKNCDSDQLKAHAIYRWLSSQSLAYYAKSINGSKPTVPTSKLKQLADGRVNHATIFQEMARSVGLRCEKIDGYAKGDNYLPGSPIRSPCNQHSWNAVAFNGHYALMDAKFGALPYKFFVEHYFMTPPDEFRLSHYPKDKKWLLMTQAFSLEDFDATLKTWPTMVAFNIRPLNMKSVLRTYDGRLSITVLLRSVAVTPQLEYAGPGAKLDSESLALLIDQEIRSVDNAETFHVTLPQEGTYFFTLLVHDIEEDEDIPVFQYRIEYADELL